MIFPDYEKLREKLQKMNSVFDKFTNQYPVHKTLRFALRPIGKTNDWIREKGLLQKDEERAEKYKDAKKIIDEYHKYFIQEKLSCFKFEENDLRTFACIYDELKRDRNNNSLKRKLAQQQDKLRHDIAKHLNSKSKFGEEFIKKDLPDWLQNNDNKVKDIGIENPSSIISEFRSWTTYFGGFNKNRKNIYTDQAHSTSIGYRVIHENLPKFLDNINRYKKVKELGIDFFEVESHLQGQLCHTTSEDGNSPKTENSKLDDFFSLTGFNQCLTQEGIDQYNQIIGGQSKENAEKQQGINEKINQHAQQLQKNNQNAKEVNANLLEKLYKQILSDRNTISFRLEDIDSDAALCEQIMSLFHVDDDQNLIGKHSDVVEEFNITENLESALKALEQADPDKVYIKNDRTITDISKYLFHDWGVIRNCLEYYAENELLKGERDKWLKQSYFSFADIHQALEAYFEQYSEDELDDVRNSNNMDHIPNIKEQKQIAISQPLYTYFKSLIAGEKSEGTNLPKDRNLLKEIPKAYKEAHSVLDRYKDTKGEKLKNEKEDVQKLKRYLDALKDLQNFLKPLHVQLTSREKNRAEALDKDSSFYDKFDLLFKIEEQITPLYNQTRNYLTKKPYSVEKYKLNFENYQLAKGWDKNKEKDYTCVLFIKEKQYFLGVMDKESNTLFEDDNRDKWKVKGDNGFYKKMVYKQIANPAKDIQNLIETQPNSFERKTKKLDELKERHIPDIAKIRRNKSYRNNSETFDKKDLEAFIEYYKRAAKGYWKWCNFHFHPSSHYKNFKEFTDHVNRQKYKIEFENISKSYVDRCVEEGKLYLFQIYSKDFSPKTKGSPNLQTLYWEALFSEQNLQDVIYKLDGQAELFYRKASIKYSPEIWEKGHHVNHSKKKQHYPIIKDRRYAKDTFLFHVPVTCNFKAARVSKFNDKVKDILKNNADVNIIGIDRGERYLAYYTVINQQGKILKGKDGKYLQGGLNNPVGNKNYHELLDKREKDRDQARKSWGTVEKIKDLKFGYLSQVVHKLSKLMIENNAIVVFEDLNFGFKRGRFKIEKQIYQKLEKMLIDKLNYLVFKDKESDDSGGIMKAFQLTAPFKSFKELGKQTGFIFYVPAYHTSKICPATGFVNLLYPKYETVTKAREFFGKFDKICFNRDEKYFEFHFNYEKFTDKAKGGQQNWVACSYGTRLENFRNKNKKNQWDSREVNLVEEIETLLVTSSINFEGGQCLIEKITKQDDRNFFKRLIRLLQLTLQLRNSQIGTGEDWLISPVKDGNGDFFDSRCADASMPQDADANGAYHIALKGLLVLEQLNEKSPDLSNRKWYEFVQAKM